MMVEVATLDELPRWARALLDEARVGHLGLIDGHGRPRVLPVTFAVAGRLRLERHRPQAKAPAGRRAGAGSLAA